MQIANNHRWESMAQSVMMLFMIELHIRKIMAEKGVSPRDLALKMDISESTIYRRLRAERSVTIEEVEMFAEALDVPIGEILTIKEKSSK